jgi:hypothetical protein
MRCACAVRSSSLAADAAAAICRRDVLSDGALLELLADFNHTVTAHEESLGDWLPPSRLKPNDWSARICCDPTTKPHPCWCDAGA